eukprot:sb/3466919/
MKGLVNKKRGKDPDTISICEKGPRSPARSRRTPKKPKKSSSFRFPQFNKRTKTPEQNIEGSDKQEISSDKQGVISVDESDTDEIVVTQVVEGGENVECEQENKEDEKTEELGEQTTEKLEQSEKTSKETNPEPVISLPSFEEDAPRNEPQPGMELKRCASDIDEGYFDFSFTDQQPSTSTVGTAPESRVTVATETVVQETVETATETGSKEEVGTVTETVEQVEQETETEKSVSVAVETEGVEGKEVGTETDSVEVREVETETVLFVRDVGTGDGEDELVTIFSEKLSLDGELGKWEMGLFFEVWKMGGLVIPELLW